MGVSVNGRGKPVLTAITEVIIKARHVLKTYDTGKVRVPALRGIDLTIERGEMAAIMGPSGCGKTTLLNCLSGLDTIDEGVIYIAAVDLSKLPDNARTLFRAREMGFIFQFYNLLPVLTAVENVELPLLVSGIKPREARERAMRVLEQVHLGEWANHRPAELSGGQRQRVTIARALVNDPAIVWADEPTGDLDTQTADEIMQLMRELNIKNRQTFVVVTHDPRIGEMCDRIIRMQDGQIVDDGRGGSGIDAQLGAPIADGLTGDVEPDTAVSDGSTDAVEPDSADTDGSTDDVEASPAADEPAGDLESDPAVADELTDDAEPRSAVSGHSSD